MTDPIKTMEKEARRQLPSLWSQGIYLWEGPTIILVLSAIVAFGLYWIFFYG